MNINIINMEDYQKNINKMKLNKIFIDDENEITFEDFYLKIIPMLKNPESITKETLVVNYNKYVINVFKINNIFCEIKLFKDNNNKCIKKYIRVLIKPLKIYYNFEQIEVAYIEQFGEILELLNIKDPYFYCNNHDKTIAYHIKDLIKHFQCNGYGINQCLIQIIENSIVYDNTERRFFNSFFQYNENKNKYEFDNPIDFDVNYENYFDFYKYQVNDKKFEFLDDQNSSRDLSISSLLCFYKILGFFRIYYGQGGMGKSITLIKTFKYDYNHDHFGTLYIHCKCLYNYYFHNFERMKKILKDEIIYLFKNEYDNYKKCLQYIDNCQNNDTFFDLVRNIIIKFCNNKSKKYIFIFDQYKAEFDPNKMLYDLNKTLIKNNKNYGMIACCSMDNKRVRELKIKNLSSSLFREEDLKEDIDNIIIQEIEEIFDISQLTIDKGGIFDQTLNKIGKTLKNYIALKEFFRKNNYLEMENYVNDLKEKICKNLKDFFHLNEKIKEDNLDSNLLNLYSVLSFTVSTDYKIDYIKEIKNIIPFKYFDIKLIQDCENTAKIVFNYELVGQVMNKIYEYIIYENQNIYQIFDNIKLDKGALGGLYEKYVIHFMEPDKYAQERKLFNLFNIQEIVTVEKFVPNSKEKYNEHKFKIRSLKEGDYLFKQEQFGGKAFDCAIIKIKKNGEAQVFFFQISIHKDKDKLYSIPELNELIIKFIDYFNYQFTFKIKQEDVYFTYIFHTKKKDELFNECNKKKLKCIFFNPSFQKFTNINNADLNDLHFDINSIFVNSFTLIDNDVIDMKDLTDTSNDITQPNFILNGKQKKKIEKLWKNLFTEFKNIKIEISYSHNTHYLDEKYLSNKIMYLRQLNEYEIKDWIDAIIADDKKKITKKINLLLIYREINLAFRVISMEGDIYQLKYLPIKEKVGLKNYDIYIIKTC